MNLINVTLIDHWNLHTCRYCKTITHAQANDSAKTLINPSLWVSSMIKLRKNDEICLNNWNFHFRFRLDKSRENQHYQNAEALLKVI